MFTSGSAAPSATMGDTHIAHSLAGTGEYIAAPCQQKMGGGRGGGGTRKSQEGQGKMKMRVGSQMRTRKIKQSKEKVLTGDGVEEVE